MEKKILVLNSGSSTLKFKVFDLPSLSVSASGIVDRIGQESGQGTIQWDRGRQEKRVEREIEDHSQAMSVMFNLLQESGSISAMEQLLAIGHRVVHGGEHFREPVLIDEKVLKTIEELIPLAPLHNPANLTGIRGAMAYAPDLPQVAIFDTAFHQTIPVHGYLYALPYDLYSRFLVRRYGFHGTSHKYVSGKAQEHLDRPWDGLKIISLHLGNGASAAAVSNGESIDTSMGFTPLEGLVMGTRSGDIDPAIIFYLQERLGMTIQQVDELLNRQSGLKGICGQSDMRSISRLADQGDQRALLAIKIFSYRVKKYIGAYAAAMGGVDCILFTGGIGENNALIREESCSGLNWMGVEIDTGINRADATADQVRSGRVVEINRSEAKVKVLIVPTDEELEIAQQTLEVVS